MHSGPFKSPNLGMKLREIRKQKGITSPHQLSKLMKGKYEATTILKRERGERRIDFQYLEDFCQILKLSGREREEIMLHGRVNWWRTRREPGRLAEEYRHLVQRAQERRLYNVGIVPGPLQSLEYAQAVIAPYEGKKSPEVVARQRVEEAQKLRRDPARRTQIICAENALYMPVGSPAVMIAQLQRLLQFEDETFCEFRILPNSVFLELPLQDDFEVLDGNYCICETRLDIVTSEEKSTAAKLLQTFDTIWAHAAIGLKRNKIVTAALSHYQAMLSK